ncbi:interferon omega-1-like [Erinaceus europaeus]|uniref:Interferon omega-1-like n=1 Tax=Erinaceus europaeus TaxID=9365 RepID=A0ABM3Y1J2_ERIEU|nr:interferon omega-1-like [Erinaceus europaeus]XP_060054925.1 interferon omega-1-like [Erinaceus europaeus]XP_060054926.1 interferon omega-1-like [Erinaceus europaeus]XP_060054929.1 interferon omega-1-like [Erinaceus europaeus]XP_060054930.1 interferon omega-1-like [Erinaceus europaeus]XP_060054931.1 interferon omega-1-like [Erinaceus europaeus]XP_060054932.1 interferon omega-1-like [Erinaceus europaeus]
MALLLCLLMTLVVLICCPSGSLGCELPQSHVLDSMQNMRLLGQMRRLSPLSCLKDRRDFRFPWQQVDGSQLQKVRVMSVQHEMVQQAFHLLLSERASAAWDKTLLDHVRTGLHQQLEHLDSCLVQLGTQEDSAQSYGSASLQMKRYFQRIRLYLKEKKDSACAWEVVRVEIMRSLTLSTTLLARVKEEELGSP